MAYLTEAGQRAFEKAVQDYQNEHPEELRVGDRVVMWRVGTVQRFNFYGMPVLTDTAPAETEPLRYTLLDRPLPPIPTADGTVIQRRSFPSTVLVRDTGHWRGRNLEDWTPDPAKWRVLVPAEEQP